MKNYKHQTKTNAKSKHLTIQSKLRPQQLIKVEGSTNIHIQHQEMNAINSFGHWTIPSHKAYGLADITSSKYCNTDTHDHIKLIILSLTLSP